jgi:PAS domain S-box-containing protein
MMLRFAFVLILIIQANLSISALAAGAVEYKEYDEPRITLTPEEQAWLAQDHTVRVRTFNWPPYMMTGGSGPLEGIAVEYLKLIEKRSGIKFSYENSSTSFAEFLANMKRRQGPDMTSLIVSSPDREEYFSFTESYLSSPYVIFARVNDDLILDINGLAGKVVAVPEGFIIQKQLTRDYPEIKLAPFDSDEQCLYAVATGKADAYIGNLTVASHIIQKIGLTDLQVVAASPYGEEDLSMGVRKDWPELASIIDKALASITEKEKTEILNNYVSVQYNQGLEKARVLRWVLTVLAVVFAVISLFIVWNRSLSRHVRERTELLSESEQRYRALFEQNQVGIIFADTETRRFKYANPAAARMLGYTQEELCALGVEDIHPPEALDLARREFEAQYKGEKGMIHALPCLRKDGSVIYADVSAQSIITSEGKFSIGFFTDITDRKQAQQAYKISEQRFRAIMEQAPFSIVVNSPDGRIIEVNQAFMDLWGISEQALPQVLEAYNILHDEEARKRGVMPLIERAFRGEAVSLPAIEYDVTSTMREMDIELDESGKRWVQVRFYPIKGERGELLNVVVLEEDITERKQAEEMLQVYQERLRALAVTLTRTEERERRKIATELHDHVGQSLAVMRIQLATARKEAGGRKVGVMLDDVSESLREAIQNTRSIMSDLSSPTLNELGLSAAIADWLKENIGGRHGLQTGFEDDGERKPLSDDTSAITFRSVRELLMNVIKHANASRVTVNTRKEGHMLKIIVEDDGVGMPASIEGEHKSDVEGFGLFSIKECMNDLDGSLSIESPPGQGVRATLSIPLEDAS